jgi:anhydro-N-acetylmuramic acid kinase
MASKKFYVIGIMSGTSLDGLDLAYCKFTLKKSIWSFKIYNGATISYNKQWRSRLSTAHTLSGENLLKLHSEYGRWIGKKCKSFIKKNNIAQLDFICSHGHTVFHQPQNKLTFQLGEGNAIHAEVNHPVVYDFRSLDVQLGGQGAPLVPIGDQYLFSDYDVCLNIGGIANLSMEQKKKRIAFDICFANMGLNHLMNSIGKDFDRAGALSSQGVVNNRLLIQLNSFYEQFQKSRPSLAREQFEDHLIPLLGDDQIRLEDRLRTFSESIANQIVESIPKKNKTRILVTGGGAKNKFLISLLKNKIEANSKIVKPGNQLIDFKESLVFGFLGVLRKCQKENVLMSVTHSKRNSVSGLLVG